MKKFLSLVLALVMTMSLVTISAGAKDYADADKITYVEAVDVLSTIGVINGMPNGSFDPKGTLTRAQAAKIITSITLTPATAAELSAETAPFTDVPVDHWAAGYVGEAAASGIINGVGNGKFDPDGELTGYAFLKMLLVALGYDATAEGMVGSAYTYNVAKLAKKVGLTAGISGFSGAKAITREEAAQLALNALKEKKAEYNGETANTITIGDVVISTNPGAASQTGDELYKNFKTLKLTKNGTDDLGRPAVKWTYEKEPIGTYAETADYTVTLEKAVDLLDYLADEDVVEAEYAKDVNFYVNGDDDADEDDLTAGSVVEIFTKEADEDSKVDEAITDVIIVNYTLGKVTKVDTDMSKKELKAGHEAQITITTDWDDADKKATQKIYDDNFAGFDYEKGDYILFAVNGDKVVASQAAEPIEGEVTATKSGKVKIDGEWYADLTKTLEEESEGTYWLNAAGQIIKADTSKDESEEYAYIYNGKVLSDETNEDGVTITGEYKVWAVLADGTKETFIVSDDTVVKGADAKGKVVTYSIDDDDELVIEKAYATEKATINKNTKKVDGAFLLSTTEFVFVEYVAKDKAYEVETVTGYKNVNVADQAAYVVANDDNEATLIFVISGNGKTTDDDTLYAVLLEDGYVERTKNSDGKYEYTYAVAVDGKETEVTFDTKLSADGIEAKGGDVVSYVLDSDDIATDVAKVAVTGKVASANDEYYFVDGEDKAYEYGDEDIITITEVLDEEGVHDSWDVSNGGDLDKGDSVILIKNSDGDVILVFVYEIDD